MALVETYEFSQALENVQSSDGRHRAAAMEVLRRAALDYGRRKKLDFITDRHVGRMGPLMHKGLRDMEPDVQIAAARGIYALRNNGAEPANDTALRNDINAYARDINHPVLSFGSLAGAEWLKPTPHEGGLLDALHLTFLWRLTNRFPFTLDGEAPRTPTPDDEVLNLGKELVCIALATFENDPTVIELHPPAGVEVFERVPRNDSFIAVNIHLQVPYLPGLRINLEIGNENSTLLGYNMTLKSVAPPGRPGSHVVAKTAITPRS